MLHDGRGRAAREVLQDVGGVVHVGQIGLAGVFARLQHLALGQGRDHALPRSAPGPVRQGIASLAQFVQGGGLIRVFTVAQAAHLAAHVPDALGVGEDRVAQGESQRIGKAVRHDAAVHILEIIAHGCSGKLRLERK